MARPHLLLHQDLLERREPAAPEFLRHVDGFEAGLVDHLLRALAGVVGEAAAVHLGLDLAGNQLVDNGPSLGLDLDFLRR